MLSVAHAGVPTAAHDLAGAWDVELGVVLGLAGLAWAYHRGAVSRPAVFRPAVSRSAQSRRGPSRGRAPGPGDTALTAGRRRRAWCFTGGLAALAVALASPLDGFAGALASAHMVQHILLLLVAAPLLALARPWQRVLRGAPGALRRAIEGRGRRIGATAAVAFVRRPIVAWLAHVAVIWVWHAAVLYEAALAHEPLHAAEHATFLGTGILFWSALIRRRPPTSPGYGLALVFALATQSVLLSALITFAGAPWYPTYRTTAPALGLDPLTDQQLAGVIMWVPANAVYLAAGLILLAAWLREAEHRPARRVSVRT